MSSFRLKTWFTFLDRNMGFTIINLTGFSVSLMFVILSSLYLRQEFNVDKFHEKRDRLFVLTSEDARNWAVRVLPDLKERFPEIESYAVVSQRDLTLDTGTEKTKIEAFTATQDFFHMFSFPFVEGDPDNQLRNPNDITLTESFARRLFGDEPAIGKSLNLDGEEFTITGVARDFEKTHFVNHDMIVRLDKVDHWRAEHYGNASFLAYVLIRENADFHSRLDDAAQFLKGHWWLYRNGLSKEVRLLPIDQAYYYEKGRWGEVKANSKRFLLILGATSLIVLLFAVINYANLSTAQSGFRAREAASRRLFGGTRRGLFLGYITESVCFCTGAFLIAFLLASMVQPAFNDLMQSNISVVGQLTPAFVLVCLIFIIVVGVISGIAPALIISRHKPIEVVKGEFTRKTKMTYSRLFIGFQFCLTIVLVGCMITIMRQTDYLRKMPVGYDRGQLLYMGNTLRNDRLPGLRERLMQVPGVELVSFTAGSPVDGGNNQTIYYDDTKTSVSFQVFEVDSCFFPMMDFEMVRLTGVKSDDAVWINETAARAMDILESGDTFKMIDMLSVAGIVKDFHYYDMINDIKPLIIRVVSADTEGRWNGDGFWNILVKINSGDHAETFRLVREAYLEYNGGLPFDIAFADQTFSEFYEKEDRTFTIIAWFSILAIVISSLGLLAMATYFVRQRSQDIAIRKVFGSDNRQMFERLIWNFLKIVAVSFAIAVPVIWFVMSEWLKGYAYRIALGWTIFALAGFVVFAIAFAAISGQIIRAANANPVDALKN